MSNLTKIAIKTTFIKLLDEKPLNQITIKSIVEECGINRNSFYYHYQDLPALIEDIVTEEADRIMKEYPAIDSIETALNASIDFASKKRRAILHIYNSVNRDTFEQYLWKVCDYVVAAYAKTVFTDKQINDFDKEIICQFYKCECFGFTIDWMNKGMNSDIHPYITRFCQLHKGMTEELIRRSMNE